MFVRYLLKTLRLILLVAIALLLVRSFLIEPGRVNGRSMEPTYFDERVFFINKFLLLVSQPERGQIIQFIEPISNELFIKRIVGLPGEQIQIQQNKVFLIDVNGKRTELIEDYLPTNTVTRSATGGAEDYQIIADNQYFVLGDNRKMSHDSRHFGAVDRSLIQGVVIK
ncbi:MAG: signal peptidase I [Candidatus Uhrbacteria bacterium]